MLAIVVRRPGQPDRRATFAIAEIQIGRAPAPTNQLVLDADGVDDVHVRVVVRDRRCILVPLARRARTYFNGSEFLTPVVMSPDHRIGVGPFELQIVEHVPAAEAPLAIRSPVERALLDAVLTDDDRAAARLVYADWLEANGDADKAELLRVQHRLRALDPDDPGFEPVSGQLRELASRVERSWLARIAERPIEGCAFVFECPKQWSALAATDDAAVRYCGACRQTVHYCASVEDARAHAAEGHCVALDITAPRWEHDLAQPFGVYRCDACDIDLGVGLDRCPRCTQPIATPRTLVRGRMA
ncbi:MAG TPA: TIGR02996 domain-containing protein [Kofleriaceae bacterium]|nr:TIGR02996 domain-containing protein [Kofleriaceae bacterium]